ncbi:MULTISPECIES: exonuclease SbcCD subunit D [Vibrio]|jgi:exonuclease SbcD|uniref:Nuclease SbcCD subunit D n=1 Tax=Vibrio natriegens NBRC 15636 = ATCC 14048 = DSM 759 TaxID=1219067 RepID=A0AAN0Y5E4_VIBNA|nr:MULTISPECIES: exonuclease SbcCD subunit D [Vibrio]ALR18241.1 exonuclease SbcD [Vibrio natriegens NBRC 15636 = ATCC 14048 = DSM 759]ANQ14189.1 exonuclease sbcCD subunit D [Vibrio natriegens NBRC 15636 = ATCC 14048 = DSM 759]ANQ19327.1 exonuclease sbcCD subunit D [Vibrio natriegens]AXT72677.1 exonuclease SbcCD subunit D [Vibrio sp. dhg]EPM40226.1 exonuclease SbcD [Vibrio natriegens NBRC 15636 = ATCC 14048 = DSM 759]
MKFIHTSDWHLGRQFHNVSLLDDQQAVLEQLISYIEDNPVDAVVVAGDVYDRSVPPTVAIELLNRVVKRICTELKTPMILISGNHDGAERLGFGSEQMKNSGLHIISNFEDMLSPVVITTKAAGEVALYGMPYNDPEQVRFAYKESVSTHDEAHKLLVEKITEQFQPQQRRVLISHCFVDGAIESDSERPLSIGGSDRVSHEHFLDFDYVALGHLHQPQKKGEEYIRYSGSLMKYSFGEQNQKKGFTLVEINESGFASAEHIELTAPHEMRIIEGDLEQVIEKGKTDPKSEDYLLVRLMDKHAILNPMEKLRAVYPNVLHLEKPGMLIGVEQEMAQAKLARSEIDMFRDFFSEAQDSQLSQEQERAVNDIIKQLSQL